MTDGVISGSGSSSSAGGGTALEAGVILVTGVMAAGKSTVAQLLAEQLPRSAHVRGDVFRRFVISGRVEPTPDMPAAALEQLLLRYRLAIASADAYARAGFVAVVQDIIVGPLLQEVVDMIKTTPRYLVVLDPEPDAIAAREARRAKSGYGQGWEPAGLVAEMRQTTPRLGLWLDTTAQFAPDTVQMILSRLPEALIDPAARVP